MVPTLAENSQFFSVLVYYKLLVLQRPKMVWLTKQSVFEKYKKKFMTGPGSLTTWFTLEHLPGA